MKDVLILSILITQVCHFLCFISTFPIFPGPFASCQEPLDKVLWGKTYHKVINAISSTEMSHSTDNSETNASLISWMRSQLFYNIIKEPRRYRNNESFKECVYLYRTMVRWRHIMGNFMGSNALRFFCSAIFVCVRMQLSCVLWNQMCMLYAHWVVFLTCQWCHMCPTTVQHSGPTVVAE